MECKCTAYTRLIINLGLQYIDISTNLTAIDYEPKDQMT